MTPMTTSRVGEALAFAVLPAEDLSRARTFYHDTLGFEIEEASGGQLYVHAGKGTSFLVYERARTTAQHTVMTLIVDDLEATMDDLRGRGIRFEEYDLPGLKTVDGVATLGTEKSAWFVDSEGNIIALAQMLA